MNKNQRMQKKVTEKLNELPTSGNIKNLEMDSLLIDADGKSSFATSMADSHSIHSKRESG